MAEITITRNGIYHEGLEDEADLMRRAQTDLAYFTPIYERYVSRIYYYCLRRLGNADEAEDLTSAVFTHALNGLKGYRGGSVKAWLFSIAHNDITTYFRRRHKPAASISPPMVASPAESAIENVIHQEQQQRIQALIAALPDDQQELLALKIGGGLSAREIGAIVGKSEGAVRVAIFRIIDELRSQMQGEDYE